MWTRLKSELSEQIVEHVPLKLDHKPKKKDYISRATKRHMRRRSKAWKRYRQFRSGKKYEEYKKIRNYYYYYYAAFKAPYVGYKMTNRRPGRSRKSTGSN